MDILECLFCKKHYPLDVFSPFCPECREPMFFARARGQRQIRTDEEHPLERYLDFLPLERVDTSLSLGEGNTPLVKLNKVGGLDGLPLTYAKFEAQNPTLSFKDRGTSVAVQKAVSLGFRRIGTVSTGNMAASTAAYGARAGLETTVLLKEETSLPSLLAAGIFGPRLVRVKGDYGRLFYQSLEIGKKLGIYFMNSIDPVRVEGYKITGFEIFQGLGRRSPDYIFVPVSSGGHLIGLMRAFDDLLSLKSIKRYPNFVGVQAEGCAPLARAFAAGKERYGRLGRTQTIAHAISNPAPPGGNVVLKMVRERGGLILSVPDDEILDAQRTLASGEGLFCQPESAVTLAGLNRLYKGKKLAPSEIAVLVLTGSGLKAPKALEAHSLRIEEAELAGLEKELELGLFRGRAVLR
jgi:threonine synthase